MSCLFFISIFVILFLFEFFFGYGSGKNSPITNHGALTMKESIERFPFYLLISSVFAVIGFIISIDKDK
ncbi:MAG: hypothetical protein WCP69_07885 [Bacteroidota bacterium]